MGRNLVKETGSYKEMPSAKNLKRDVKKKKTQGNRGKGIN